MKNLHVPLQDELHAALMAHARKSGESATALARQAIVQFVREAERAQRRAELAAFAAEYAGTDWDLDPNLERAGLESLALYEAAQENESQGQLEAR
ncbi:hypothetical protein Q0M94_02435 [Deinococcus radiomollis]|uniref:hypothetical protein n=1 Tax=Deinococcus radiomollis TaxID=468916 RepID=UPI0038918022